MHLYVPPDFSQHPIVVDPPNRYLSSPEQQISYNIAQKMIADYGSHPDKIVEVAVARIGHNMMVAGINYMPLSLVEHPADVMRPYSYWQGFDFLIVISDGQVRCEYFKIGVDPQAPVMRSINLYGALRTVRRYWYHATNEIDRKLLQAAIDEYIYQLDAEKQQQMDERLERKQREGW